MTHATLAATSTAGQRDAAVAAPALRERRLADRIRQCVPLRHPAFGKLLQLLSIEASDAVATAAVTVGASSRLLVNPGFVAKRCRTDEHLAMLVMHELYHVLLGHTRLYPRPTLAANWAFDCIVNAQLCRQHPEVEFTSFFAAGAAAARPWSLIGPPAGWPDAPRYAADALGDVHRRLYDDAGVTTADLFALLDRVALALDVEDAGRLLGNHDDEAAGAADALHADPDLLAQARCSVDRWPALERRGGAAADGQALRWDRSELRRHHALRRAVRELLRAAACGSDDGRRSHRPTEVQACTPLPQAGDRRAQLQRLLGAQPLWWQGVWQHADLRPAGQVAVYLDVSGSMAAWLPALLDALSESAAWVRWPLYGFSTAVHPLTRAELAAGRFRTTGATHIACVAEHLAQSRIARAVVLTDGDVQQIPAPLAQRLRRARPPVRVGLLAGCDASFCAPLGWPVVPLPALDQSRGWIAALKPTPMEKTT